MLTFLLMHALTDIDPSDLTNPELYINRELSQLEFMRRVVAQAEDESVPLLERLRFLCIASSVLDEFFEIRVAGLKQQEAYGSTQRGPDNLSPADQLRRIGPIAQGGGGERLRQGRHRPGGHEDPGRQPRAQKNRQPGHEKGGEGVPGQGLYR